MALPKIIAIVGPTASGKTDLGLALAKEFNGEIVSADSRQIYKKMNIGTAKPTGEWSRFVIPSKAKDLCNPLLSKEGRSVVLGDRPGVVAEVKAINGTPPLPLLGKEGMPTGQRFLLRRRNDKSVYLVDGIPHHLMDIVDPGDEFSLADYKQRALAAIEDILSRGKLPIVVGGTGLYIRALADNFDIPKIEPSKKLRQQLEKKSLAQLVALLKKVDPVSAQKVDLKNPRRVLRALEVFILSGESFFNQRTKSAPLFNMLPIGINLSRAELFARIDRRVDQQIKDGLVEETKSLAKQKYGWNLPSMSGIGYKQIGFYVRGEKSLAEAVELLKRDSRRYAKRQMTWFNQDKRIRWLAGDDYAAARELVKKFLLRPSEAFGEGGA